ncbi:MAG: inorganic diphosphatase [Rickettsiales bacterium]|nr:inorganic diphosphatase [Rickettsiales bacterium]
MGIEKIPCGKNPPEEVNVYIEIPVGSHPVKYELDKESSVLHVDRFFIVSMTYPCNYGFIPKTLSEDGDPVDVLVITGGVPLIPGCVISVRPIGVLLMEDEAGGDEKILAVPTNKTSPQHAEIKSYFDLPQSMLCKVIHFFENYKSLDKDKWVKVKGWGDASQAKKMIIKAIERAKKKK